MKKILLSLTLIFVLGGCTLLQRLEQTTVNPKTVYLAINTFNGIEITATGYLRICYARMSTPGCEPTIIAKVIPAVRGGRVARDNLKTFMRSHPDALGAQGLYDVLVTTTNTLQQFSINYSIAGASK